MGRLDDEENIYSEVKSANNAEDIKTAVDNMDIEGYKNKKNIKDDPEKEHSYDSDFLKKRMGDFQYDHADAHLSKNKIIDKMNEMENVTLEVESDDKKLNMAIESEMDKFSQEKKKNIKSNTGEEKKDAKENMAILQQFTGFKATLGETINEEYRLAQKLSGAVDEENREWEEKYPQHSSIEQIIAEREDGKFGSFVKEVVGEKNKETQVNEFLKKNKIENSADAEKILGELNKQIAEMDKLLMQLNILGEEPAEDVKASYKKALNRKNMLENALVSLRSISK